MLTRALHIARIEERIRRATQPLGRAHGHVGVRHQVRRGAVLGVQRNADRAAHAGLLAGFHMGHAHALQHQGGQRHHCVAADALVHQQHELIATLARHQVRAGQGVQALADGAEHAVAAGLAQHFIHRAKAVQADVQQGQHRALRIGRGNGAGQGFVEPGAVGQAGGMVLMVLGGQGVAGLRQRPAQARFEHRKAAHHGQQQRHGHRGQQVQARQG